MSWLTETVHRSTPRSSLYVLPAPPLLNTVLMLPSAQLYFKTFVRIIIPTANAVDYDWAIIDNVSTIRRLGGPALQLTTVCSKGVLRSRLPPPPRC